MPDYHIPLFPDRYYHLLSHAVGSEKLFRNDDNRRYFIEKLDRHIGPVCEVYAWCLLDNHFHLLVRIKTEPEIEKAFVLAKKGKSYSQELASDFLMERFSNWLNGYAKAFNKMYKRRGALFLDYLRRVEIIKDSQFSATLFYIHKNPVHHGLCREIVDWKWSSYSSILSDKPTKLKRSEILEWFGGKDGFMKFHTQPIQLKHSGEME